MGYSYKRQITQCIKGGVITKIAYVKIKLLIMAFALLILSNTVACSNFTEKEPVVKTGFMLDTLIEIKAYGPTASGAIDKAFNRIADIENKMTINADTSEVIRVNEGAGKSRIAVSPDTFHVIKKGLYHSKISKGRFDITVGPLVKLWGIGTGTASVPTAVEIDEVLPLVDYRQVELDEKQNSVFLKNYGMALDLGGIAKGYATDEVVKILKQNGVSSGIADLGGNIYALGTKPNKNPWKIGLQNPFETRGSVFATVEVVDKTLVTSGPYERYFEEEGRMYHHIFDIKTGLPVKNDLLSVTIIADNSMNADAISTTAFILGLPDGLKFVEKLEHTDAVFVTNDYKVFQSSGVKKYNFKIIDEQFFIKKNFD